MLKLHGAALSNYYNMAKAALLEKSLEFEEVLAPPSQEPVYLAKSPMGKIPCLESEHGFVSESGAILEYLETIAPEPPLIPADPWAAAKVRELMASLPLYIELPARRGYGALRGGDVSQPVKDEIRLELNKGIAAIGRLAKFSPWIAGDEFSAADLVGYFSFQLASLSAQANADLDLFEALPGSKNWYGAVTQRESVRQALADRDAVQQRRG